MSEMNGREPWLGNAKATSGVLKKHNIRIKKKFGQNFLIDNRVLEKIILAAQVSPDDVVLEIGPGIGTLTQYLAASAKEVIAVEIDRTLEPVLSDTLSGFPNVTVLYDDILKVDLLELAEKHNSGKPFKIVANLPYYITTPIVTGLLESRFPIESMTFMVQKEVAERMAASPGGKDYGALTLAVQYYCTAELNAVVPQNCFIPRPDVTSAVITLRAREERIPVSDEKLLFAVIRAAFSMRRKTLVNCLAAAPELGLGKEKAAGFLQDLGMDVNIRGEALSLQQFAALTDRIAGSRNLLA